MSPKALIIAKMKTTVDRGVPDVAQAVSFVHCGSVVLPGNYKAMVISGTAAALTAVTQHANFLAGQQITKTGDVENWADARTAIAAGARTKINTFLAAQGLPVMTAENSIVDLIRVFQPDYEPGSDNVHDGAV